MDKSRVNPVKPPWPHGYKDVLVEEFMFVFVTALFFLTHDPFIHLSLPPVFPSTVIVLTALTCVLLTPPPCI